MGIAGLLPNLRSVQRPVHVREYSGKRVAVDGYCWLHRGAFSCSRELCEGRPTRRYVDYCLKLVAMMQACGVIPLVVFDGGKLPMKLAEEDGRDRTRREYHEKAVLHLRSGNTTAANECFQRAVDIAPWMAAEVVAAMRAIGVECIVAPYEADCQMAYLALNGFVHALVTEDSDLLVYGCPRVLFKMDHAGMGFEIRSKDLPLTREILLSDFTADQFLEMCIMSGCDYLPSVSGVGVKKAHSYISRFKTHSKAIRHMRLEGLRVDKGYEERFAEAILTFRHQWVYCPTAKELVNLNPVPVDVDLAGLRRLIGDGHPPDIAHGIAVAQLDPVTCQPFSPLLVSGGDASEVAPGVGKQSSRPKASSRPLPIQKNTLSNYFRLPKSADAAKPFAAPRMSAAPTRGARAHNSTSGERAAQEELGPASSYGVDKERAVGVAKEDRPHKRPCLAALSANPAWAREVVQGAVEDEEEAVEDRGSSDGDLSPVMPHPMAWTAPSKRASVVLSASRQRIQFQKPRSIHSSEPEGLSSSNMSAKFAPVTTSRFFDAPVPKVRLVTAKNDAAAALSSFRPTGPPPPAASPTSPHQLRAAATATDMKLITDRGSTAHCRELGEKATTALDRLEAKAPFESFRCRASPVLASPSPMPSFASLDSELDIFSDELNDAPPSGNATLHGHRELPKSSARPDSLFESFTYAAQCGRSG